MPIETNRSLGTIGSYLTLLGVISTVITLITIILFDPTVSFQPVYWGLTAVSSIIGILTFVGFILFLIAMYGFSRDYGEHMIFKYIIYGLIGAIVTGIVVFALWFILAMTNILSDISSLNPPTNQLDVQSIITPYFSSLLPFFSIVGLIWIIFNVKAYNRLADKSQVDLFRTAAKLLLAGAIVNIAVGVLFAALALSGIVNYRFLSLAGTPGAIVQYVAWWVTAKAFLQIKQPSTQTVVYSTAPTVPSQVRYCSNCGTANQFDSTYCIPCGQRLQ